MEQSVIAIIFKGRTDPGFPAGGAKPLTYDFAKISEQLHENEKFVGRVGGGAFDPPLKWALVY